MLRIVRYGTSRFWALYDGQALVVVTVYKRGAREVRRRLAAQPRATAEAAAEAVAQEAAARQAQALAAQARALARQAQAAAQAARARAQRGPLGGSGWRRQPPAQLGRATGPSLAAAAPPPGRPPSGQVLARGHTRPTRGTYAYHLTRLREGVPCSAPVLDRAAVASFHLPSHANPRGTAAPGVVRGRAPHSLQQWLATRQSRSWQPGQLPWPFRWPR